MKTKLLFGGLMWVLATAAWNAAAASHDELLEKGIYTEETKGDLKASSQIYQQIVDDPEAQRNLVAQAQLRLGFCELKLGNKPQAISALERLTQEFPDKDALLAMVEKHMPLLLEDMLRQAGIERLMVLGLATDYCVKETVLDAVRLGFETKVLREGVRAVELQPGDASRALDQMSEAGADVV